MAEQPRWPATLAGEGLRRKVAERRRIRRRLRLLALTVLVAALLAASAGARLPILLVWNASASAPLGLYAVRSGALPRRGDMVVAWVPGPARSLAAARQYLPANVPLVKRVAAAPGDRLCARGPDIRINGRLVAKRLERDRSGRPMPWWTGCRRLEANELFLLTDSPQSFDGRYFGVTRKSDIVGSAGLLWAF